MARRGVQLVIAVGMAIGLAAMPVPAQAHGGHDEGRFDRPQSGFMSSRTTLRTATPQQAGLDPVPIEAAWRSVVAATSTPAASGHPLYPGAVLSYGHDGKVVLTRATGYSRLYADGNGTLLPVDQRIATRTDTIYDLASVTKLFTSIVIMQQVERGRIDLDQTVVHYLPEFAEGSTAEFDKTKITIRMLLTHTSGFPAFEPFWSLYPDSVSRLHAVLTWPLDAAPGSTYLYSDLNLITLGELAHRLTGRTLSCCRGSRPPSISRRHPEGWSGGRCTTRTPGPSAECPATPACSPPPPTWPSWRRPC